MRALALNVEQQLGMLTADTTADGTRLVDTKVGRDAVITRTVETAWIERTYKLSLAAQSIFACRYVVDPVNSIFGSVPWKEPPVWLVFAAGINLFILLFLMLILWSQDRCERKSLGRIRDESVSISPGPCGHDARGAVRPDAIARLFR